MSKTTYNPRPRWLNVWLNRHKQTKNNIAIVLQHFISKEMNKQYEHMIEINQIIYCPIKIFYHEHLI